jgi:NTP pyrophosphatase (non-canonical NTP hydrolase)
LHHAAGIAEQIRRRGPNEKLHTEIADFSLWLFTAILKLTGKFGQSEGRAETPQESLIRIQSNCSDLIWHKYPKLCPRCFASDKANTEKLGPPSLCECLEQRSENEGDETRRKRITAVRHYSDAVRIAKPSGLDEWQEMFRAVFAKKLAALSSTDIALHLMEELGEVSDAMVRMYTYKEKTFRLAEPNWRQANLEGQLADVFSWLLLLAEKLNILERERHQDEEKSMQAEPQLAESDRLSGIIWRR